MYYDKEQIRGPIVPLGQIVTTANAHAQLSSNDILAALRRYGEGDWGDVDEEDWKANDEAVQSDERIHSSYKSSHGVRFWIITARDRSITTVLLPDDY